MQKTFYAFESVDLVSSGVAESSSVGITESDGLRPSEGFKISALARLAVGVGAGSEHQWDTALAT